MGTMTGPRGRIDESREDQWQRDEQSPWGPVLYKMKIKHSGLRSHPIRPLHELVSLMSVQSGASR